MTIQKSSKMFQSQPMEPDAEELPTLNLTDFLRILRTHKKTIFGTAALVIALTVLTIAILTPLYTATSYVLLDPRQNNVTDANAVTTDLAVNPTSTQNQVQILRSRALAARVIDKLNLINDPEFNPPKDDNSFASRAARAIRSVTFWFNPRNWFVPPSPPAPPADPKDPVINLFLANLTVTLQGLSSTIGIAFESIDAQKAAKIANAIADAYVEDELNAKFEATQKAQQWLSERLQQVSTQTQASERAVEEYKAKNNLTDTATPGTSLIEQQLTALSTQLISAQADLAQQEAKYGQVLEMQKSGHAADVTQVIASPLISQLRQQETEILRQEAELSSRYGPLHPKVLDMESQKQNLATKIDDEVRRVVQAISGDVEVARVRVRSLQDSLSQITAKSQGENVARIKLTDLTSSATSNRTLYDAFLARFKEIEGQTTVQTPDSRVISTATVPPSPSFPNKLIFLGAALPGGLILGILLAMLSDSMASGFRTRQQVEYALSLPVLTALPEVPRSRRRIQGAADYVVDRPTSYFAEGVRGLQLGLVLSSADKPPKIIVVTSAVPSEGKTTVAVSLARIAAGSGQRVILMDADFRQPSVARALGISPPQKGIADVLSGNTTLEDCLLKDPKSNVLLLPAIGKSANPSDLLASEEMANVIRALSASCDLLIIDTSPLLPVNDARILARQADAVILAVRWERTPRAASLHALRSLTDVMAPVAGIVLTRTDKVQFRYDNYGKQAFRDFNRYHKD